MKQASFFLNQAFSILYRIEIHIQYNRNRRLHVYMYEWCSVEQLCLAKSYANTTMEENAKMGVCRKKIYRESVEK